MNKDIKKEKLRPELRFREFKEEWEKKTLGEVSTNVMYGLNASAKEFDGTNKYIRITDIDETNHIFTPSPLTSPSGKLNKEFLLNEGDIVFTRTGASTGKTYLYNNSDGKIYFAGFLVKFNISSADPRFVFYQTLRSSYNKWVQKTSMRSGQPGINAEEYKTYRFYLPSLPEQQKISSFLSLIDKKIELLNKKKKLLEIYKKGIMHNIFNRDIRFKDRNGNDYPEWEETKLSSVLTEHKLKSFGNEEVYSVSVHHGLINQIEHLGRSFSAANTSNYNLVKNGDVVYTKSPTGEFPYGIIKQSNIQQNVIVSPLYGVFTPDTQSLGYILDTYFESPLSTSNYLHPLIEKGAKNTMNISNSTFLSGTLILPTSKEETYSIAKFLEEVAKETLITFNLQNLVSTFKKGLLQRMFI